MNQCSFKVNPQAVVSMHPAGIVILHTGSGVLFSSNATGARVWSGIERELCFETIVEELCAAYQIARTTANDHAQRFLTELERHSLVQREVAS